jgi:hypothetical protein
MRDTSTPISSLEDSKAIPEIKVITENDLKIEHILIEEFRFRGEYIKQVASDVTSTFNLYFIFIGISVSGLGLIYQVAGGIGNNLQTIEALILLILGVTSSLFFLRFVALMRNHSRQKACMDVVREYYIKHLRNQIPDISNIFRVSMVNIDYYHFRQILFFAFGVADSLFLAGAVFVFVELWLGIRSNVYLFFPSDIRPYIFALLIGVIVLPSHILFTRSTVYRYQQELQDIIAKEMLI